MKKPSEIELKILEVKPFLSKKFHVSSIGYFGSYASGKPNKKSDVDVLVTFSKPIGWEFFELEDFLEKTIGIKVDLATPDSLKKQVKERIMNEVKYI